MCETCQSNCLNAAVNQSASLAFLLASELDEQILGGSLTLTLVHVVSYLILTYQLFHERQMLEINFQ